MKLPNWMLNPLLLIIFFVLFLFGMVGVSVITSLGWSGFMSFVTSNPWLGVPMAIGLIPVLILLPVILLVVVLGIAQS